LAESAAACGPINARTCWASGRRRDALSARILDKMMVDTKNMATNTALARISRLLRPRLRCSFCKRSADDVGRLVAGASAHICDECITKCIAVLEQHGGLAPAPRSAH
jgi:hypothetical protein